MSQNPGMNAPYGQQPGYPAPGAVPVQSGGGSLVPGGALAIAGGIAAIVGAFLSWASIALAVSAGGQSQSVNLTVNGLGKISGAPGGADMSANSASDGYLVMAAGVIALIGGVVLLATKKSAGAILALIGGVAALGLGIYELTQVSGVEDGIKKQMGAVASGVDFKVSASAGIGLWIVLVGGALALIGGIVAMMGARKRV